MINIDDRYLLSLMTLSSYNSKQIVLTSKDK